MNFEEAYELLINHHMNIRSGERYQCIYLTFGGKSKESLVTATCYDLLFYLHPTISISASRINKYKKRSPTPQ